MLESRLENAGDRRARIDLLHTIAWLVQLEEREKARAYAEEAYALSTRDEFADNPYPLGLAGSLRTLASLNNDTGDYATALSQSLQALEVLDTCVDQTSEADLVRLHLLGVVSWTYRCLGEYVTATEYAIAGQKLAHAVGEQQRETGMLNILSVIYAESDDLAAALEIGQKVVEDCRVRGHVQGECIALNNLAMTYLELGDGEEALAAARESLRMARKYGVEVVALTALSTLGEIYLGLEQYDAAEETLSRALARKQHRPCPYLPARRPWRASRCS